MASHVESPELGVAPALEGFAAMSLLGEDAPTPPFGKFFKDYRETEW